MTVFSNSLTHFSSSFISPSFADFPLWTEESLPSKDFSPRSFLDSTPLLSFLHPLLYSVQGLFETFLLFFHYPFLIFPCGQRNLFPLKLFSTIFHSKKFSRHFSSSFVILYSFPLWTNESLPSTTPHFLHQGLFETFLLLCRYPLLIFPHGPFLVLLDRGISTFYISSILQSKDSTRHFSQFSASFTRSAPCFALPFENLSLFMILMQSILYLLLETIPDHLQKMSLHHQCP